MVIVYIMLGVFVLLLASVIWPWSMGAAWTPTPMPTVRKMLKMARVSEGDVLYDLGSGDGRIIVTAGREFRAQATGIEIEPIRFLYTWLRLRLLGLNGQVHIRFGDIFKQDLQQASVITVFLTNKANNRLKAEAFGGLKPKTRVVSYLWTFDKWQPVEVDEENRIYLYEV